MHRIYRLKNIANDKLEHLGHLVGKYNREFEIDPTSGDLIRILKNSCVKCGAPVTVIDKPNKIYKECITGSAVEIFCKKGSLPVEKIRTENVFAPNDKKEYKEHLKRSEKSIKRRFDIK